MLLMMLLMLLILLCIFVLCYDIVVKCHKGIPWLLSHDMLCRSIMHIYANEGWSIMTQHIHITVDASPPKVRGWSTATHNGQNILEECRMFWGVRVLRVMNLTRTQHLEGSILHVYWYKRDAPLATETSVRLQLDFGWHSNFSHWYQSFKCCLV